MGIPAANHNSDIPFFPALLGLLFGPVAQLGERRYPVFAGDAAGGSSPPRPVRKLERGQLDDQ